MSKFDDCFEVVIGHEGGLSLDPQDPGNWVKSELRGTKYGISARAFPDVDIRNLTLDEAKSIYRTHYWTPIKGDTYPAALALALFDTSVNAGVGAALKLLSGTKDWRVLLGRRLDNYTDLAIWNSQGKGWARRIARLFEQCAELDPQQPMIKRVFLNGTQLILSKLSQVSDKLYLVGEEKK